MFPFGLHFIAEKVPCEPHFCLGFEDFIKAHEKQLSEDHSMATQSLSIAYLRFLNFIRANSSSISKKQVYDILSKYHKSSSKDGKVVNTILDAVSGSRHGPAMMAAFQFLDLPKCHDDKADLCERFLIGTAISSITTANMGSSFLAEHSLSAEQLLDLFLPLTSFTWADERIQHAYGLTLATLLHSYHVFERYVVDEAENSATSHHLYAQALIAPHSSPLFVDISGEGDAKTDQERLGLKFKLTTSRLAKTTVSFSIVLLVCYSF